MNDGLHGVWRHITLGAGILLAGTVCAWAVPFTMNPRGEYGPSLLLAHSPAAAIGMVALYGLAATGIAAVVAKLTNAAVGLFVLGSGLFVLSHRTATASEAVFAGIPLLYLALETALWTAALLGVTIIVFRASGPLRDMLPTDAGERPARWWSGSALLAALSGVVVLAGVWLIARSPMKGQTIASVIIGGMAAGMIARLRWPQMQPVLVFAAVCAFGAIGHAIGAFLEPGPHRFVTDLHVLNYPMPIDYAAGSLIGVSLGLGWARSFLHPEHGSPQARESDGRVRPAAVSGRSE